MRLEIKMNKNYISEDSIKKLRGLGFSYKFIEDYTMMIRWNTKRIGSYYGRDINKRDLFISKRKDYSLKIRTYLKKKGFSIIWGETGKPYSSPDSPPAKPDRGSVSAHRPVSSPGRGLRRGGPPSFRGQRPPPRPGSRPDASLPPASCGCGVPP